MVRWFAWQPLAHGTKGHTKTIGSSDDFSCCSTGDSRRMRAAAIAKPTTKPSASHQRLNITLAMAPKKKTARMDNRQHSDHNTRHGGNHPACRASTLCDGVTI